MTSEPPLASSFRDPSGYVFRVGDLVYRHVSNGYSPTLEALTSSGLYDRLVSGGMLVPHEDLGPAENGGRVLLPKQVATISYPYEWCFGQFQDAALCTLEVHRLAIESGLVLKDASAYNVQFLGGRPTLIDTLSFEEYVPTRPWVAYRQFCEHFLAPLALMAHVDLRLGRLLQLHLDGIPLAMASRMLPGRTRLDAGLAVHIHTHAAVQQRNAGGGSGPAKGFSKVAMLGLVDSLKRTVEKLKPFGAATIWGDYYADTNYSKAAQEDKRAGVLELVSRISPAPKAVWDLGANTGEISRLLSDAEIDIVAWDMDPVAVEKNYR